MGVGDRDRKWGGEGEMGFWEEIRGEPISTGQISKWARKGSGWQERRVGEDGGKEARRDRG